MAVNIFELFGTISVKNSDANKAIDNTVNAAKNAGQKLVDIGDAMGKLGSGMTKAITVPITGAITASIKSFADLEQAVGGIETMFEDSAGTVISNSETAFQRAGVSGTRYMEQVTSFSATLLQGLGGDTEKAANYADTAMVDMSDNANKFGTNIGDIQNAYQGFAKDNYTMLDNLKLGYGGTAGEMARLINESGVLGDTFEATAENVKDIPFHTMIEAIHVTQEEMGVTGTTALEAEETVSGAFGMMLASVQDLAAGFGQEGADMETLLANVAYSVETFAANIVRVLGNMWDNIPLPNWAKWAGALITAAGPVLIVLGKIISTVGKVGIAFQGATTFMGGMAALFPNLANGIGLLGTAFSYLSGPIGIAIAAIGAIIGALIYLYNTNETVRNAIQTAWQFIQDTIATVSQAIEALIQAIWGRIQVWLVENQALITQTIEMAWGLISGIISAALAVIVPLVTFAWETITTITQVAWELITSAIQIALEVILGIITLVLQLIQGDWAGAWTTIQNVASTIWGVIVETARTIFNILREYFVNLWTAVSELFMTVWGYISEFLSGIWTGILGVAQTIWGAIQEFFMVTIPGIVNGIIEWFQKLPERISAFFTRIIESAIEWVSNMTTRATEIGTQFVDRVVQFIQELPYKVGFFLGEVVGAAIQWVIDMGTQAREAGSTFLENVETYFRELPGRVGSFLTDTYNRATTWASNMWNKAQETGRNFLDRITNWFTQLPGRIGSFLTDAYNRATTWASNMWNKATEAGSRFLTNIINWFQRLPGRVQDWFNRTITRASDFVRNMGTKATEAGREFGNKITSTLRELPGQLWDIGVDIIDGLWGGLQSAWDNLTGWFGGLVTGFVDGVKSRLDIASPSGVFEHEIGEEIPAGMAKGIDNKQSLVDRALDAMLQIGQVAMKPLLEPQLSRDGIAALTGGSTAREEQRQNGLQLLLTEIRNILGQINDKEETIIVEIDGQRYEVSEDGESVRKISNSLYNMQRTHDRSKGGR